MTIFRRATAWVWVLALATALAQGPEAPTDPPIDPPEPSSAPSYNLPPFFSEINQTTSNGTQGPWPSFPDFAHRPCLRLPPNVTMKAARCQCDDLWTSDCACDASDAAAERKCRNCADLCELQLWQTNVSAARYAETRCLEPLTSQVRVRVWTRPMHTWGAELIRATKAFMEFMGPSIDLDIRFLAEPTSGEPWALRSKHGPVLSFPSVLCRLIAPCRSDEVLGSLYQMCVMRHYPSYREYLPFLACMTIRLATTPNRALNCSLTLGLNFSAIHQCATGPEGHLLVAASYNEASWWRVSLDSLPQLNIAGVSYSIGKSASPEGLVLRTCQRLNETPQVFPLWIFGFMASLLFALVVTVFVIKQWNGDSFIGFLRSLFFFEGLGGAEGEGWQEMLPDEFFHEHDDHDAQPDAPQAESQPQPAQEAQAENSGSESEPEEGPRSFFADLGDESEESDEEEEQLARNNRHRHNLADGGDPLSAEEAQDEE